MERLQKIDRATLERIVPGYETQISLVINERTNVDGELNFEVSKKKLSEKVVKHHDYSDPETVNDYNRIVALGKSWGVFENERCLGFIIAEYSDWNKTAIIREFGVDPDVRRKGIGRKLMDKVFEEAKAARMRSILCETQTTNYPAIEFYLTQDFKLTGFDLALYSNEDEDKNDVAIYLRKSI